MREQESQGGSDSSAQLAREPTILSGDRDYNVPNFTCGTGVSECEALIAKPAVFRTDDVERAPLLGAHEPRNLTILCD